MASDFSRVVFGMLAGVGLVYLFDKGMRSKMLHSLENTKRNIDEFSDTLQEKGEKLQQRAQDGFKETKRSIGKQLRQKGEQLESELNESSM
jgi:abortive infection bacteriophage resistance protein